MSIVSEIQRINTNIANSYTAVDNKNGTLPQVQNSANLASAIDSIQSSNIIGATAEGESLSLANTKAMPYSDYVVDGKSEQDGEPSPSNPGEIHSVADDVNLFDLKNFLSDRNVSYTENEDGSLTFITSSALYLSPLQFSNEDIIVSMSGILTTLEEMSNAKIEILNSNNTVVGQINLSNSKIENITGSKLRFNITSNKTITLRNIKLQKGTEVTPYSPYNQGTVTIKQRGKNLWNNSNVTSTTIMTPNSNGGFKIQKVGNERISEEYPINIPANTNIEISRVLKDYSNGTTIYCQWIATDNTTIWTPNIYADTVTTSFNKDIKGVIFYLQQTVNDGDYVEIEKLMIRLSSIADNTYEPYQGNDYTFQTEPLRSLPNGVKDTMEDNTNRRTGEYIFDGTESWSAWNFTSDTYIGAFLNNVVPYNYSSGNDIRGICSHFEVVVNGDSTKENMGLRQLGDSNRIYLCIEKNKLSSENLAGIKDWLSDNKPRLVYQLSEEVIEPLTQNQATTMLDIIKTGSYEGTTNIYTDEDVKPTIGVGYYKYGETGGLPTVENEKLIFDKELQIDREELIF